MPWVSGPSSPRRVELPRDWYTRIRPAVLDRDGHLCQWPRPGRRDGICGSSANQVDHREDRDSYALADLWSLCQYHHMHKTQQQAMDVHRETLAKLKHPEERHPGLR
jgi:5-methylcytosine-specific restriction enzyme A